MPLEGWKKVEDGKSRVIKERKQNPAWTMNHFIARQWSRLMEHNPWKARAADTLPAAQRPQAVLWKTRGNEKLRMEEAMEGHAAP